MSYNRDDSIPRPGPSIPLVRVIDTNVHSFTILGKEIHGYWTHWNGVRTVPCRNHDEVCPPTIHSLPIRWYGYLCVIDHSKGGVAFLELTPGAAQAIRSGVPADACLRGQRFNASRTKGGAKGRLNITWLGAWTNPRTLPPEKDPEETLDKLWNSKK